MKRFFSFLLILIPFFIFSDSKSSNLYTENINYPLDHQHSVNAERIFDNNENLRKIKFREFPKEIKNKIYALKIYHKPNRLYAIKEYGTNKKLKFTHKFIKQKNGWLFKGYYPHQKNEKIQASKILYQVLKFDFEGRIQYKSYFSKYNHLTPDDTGVVTYNYVYDKVGNLIQMVSKDWKMRVHPDKHGFGMRNFTYDEKNRLSSKTFFRKEGVPKAIEKNISKLEYKYNEACFQKLTNDKTEENNQFLRADSVNLDDSFSESACIESVQYFQFSESNMGFILAKDDFQRSSISYKYNEDGNPSFDKDSDSKDSIQDENPNDFSQAGEDLLKIIEAFGINEQIIEGSNSAILDTLKSNGVPFIEQNNSSGNKITDPKTGYETIITLNTENSISSRIRRDEKNQIEEEKFDENRNLISSDYSLNFYLENGNYFHLKLDQFKRPVQVEFLKKQ